MLESILAVDYQVHPVRVANGPPYPVYPTYRSPDRAPRQEVLGRLVLITSNLCSDWLVGAGELPPVVARGCV